MSNPTSTWQDLLQRLASSMNDTELGTFLSVHTVQTEDDLADAIDIDARARDEENTTVDLHRYMTAIPGLHERAVVLDTALEAVLRSMRRAGIDQVQAVAILVEDYPRLATPIRTCAMLDQCVVGTSTIAAGVATAPPLTLPCGIGEAMDDGRERYELRDVIGRGKQAVVYLSVDRKLSALDAPAWVAIKVMLHAAREDWLEVPALGGEAHAARRINHPNVVRVLDRGLTADFREFVVYEYVRGVTLHESRSKQTGPMDAREAARLAISIARGLQAAHNAAVLHCDLKPSNVLLAEDGHPKIADFGLARQLQADEPTDGPVGSFAFMSPEQFMASADAAMTTSDIYSLGGLLYWMLTDLPPNGTDAETVGTRLRQGTDAPPIDPTAKRAGLDPDLAAICGRALHPRPERRYASAEALAGDIERYLQWRPLEWSRCSPRRRAELAFRRSPRAFVGIAGAAVCAIAATVYAAVVWHNASVSQLRSDLKVEQAIVARHKAEQSSELGKSKLQNMRDVIRINKNFMATAMASGNAPTDTLLMMSMLMDSMFESGLYEAAGEAPGEQVDRVALARKLIEEAKASGRGYDLEATFTESQLGFWLVKDGKYAEAREVIRGNIERLSKLSAGGGDRFVRAMKALEAAAEYGQMRSDPNADTAAVAAMRERLEGFVASGSLPGPVQKAIRKLLEKR